MITLSASDGLDLSRHRAQQVLSWMCQTADINLVMDNIHKSELQKKWPMVRGKVSGLGDLGKFEIADPYRQHMSAFEQGYADIARGVADWAPRIRKLH